VFSSLSTPFKQITIFFYDTFNSNATQPGLGAFLKGGSLLNLTQIVDEMSSPGMGNNTLTNSTESLTEYLSPPIWALALCSGLPQMWRMLQNCRNIVARPKDKKAIANAFK